MDYNLKNQKPKQRDDTYPYNRLITIKVFNPNYYRKI